MGREPTTSNPCIADLATTHSTVRGTRLLRHCLTSSRPASRLGLGARWLASRASCCFSTASWRPRTRASMNQRQARRMREVPPDHAATARSDFASRTRAPLVSGDAEQPAEVIAGANAARRDDDQRTNRRDDPRMLRRLAGQARSVGKSLLDHAAGEGTQVRHRANEIAGAEWRDSHDTNGTARRIRIEQDSEKRGDVPDLVLSRCWSAAHSTPTAESSSPSPATLASGALPHALGSALGRYSLRLRPTRRSPPPSNPPQPVWPRVSNRPGCSGHGHVCVLTSPVYWPHDRGPRGNAPRCRPVRPWRRPISTTVVRGLLIRRRIHGSTALHRDS